MREKSLILWFILFLFITEDVVSQDSCKMPTAEKIMDVNSVSAKILNNGKLFNKGHYITPYAPDNEKNVNAIYNSGLWMGGRNIAGSPTFSGVWFDILKNTDYFSGHIAADTSIQQQNCSEWDKIFTLKGSHILDFIKYYQNQVKTGQPLDCQRIPEDVLLWPAKGNPYFKQHFGWSLPDQDLAGFWDEDKDGIYDPCKGDYPYIHDKCENAPGYHRGEKVPAEINYFVFNDAASPQTFSKGGYLKMEVHVHAYAYNDDPVLEEATFYHYKLINKSNEYYTDFYMGYWANSDLGCPFNDAIGCDTMRGMAYIYNVDSVDDASILCRNYEQRYGISTYGENPPILGFDFVKGPKGGKMFRRSPSGQIVYDTYGKPILDDPESICQSVDTLIQLQMSSFNYFLDCSLISQAQPFCFPGYRQDLRDQFLYNVLQGLWSDGTPMTYGELGYQGTEVTKFAFPGEPADSSSWTCCKENFIYLNPSFVMSMGPICFAPDEVHEMTLAVFSVHGVPLPCPELDKLKDSNDAIQGLFDNCDVIVSTFENVTSTQEIKIFPNPKNIFQDFIIEGLYDKSTIEIFDVMGRSLFRTVTQEKSINISNANLHSSGIYWVKVTDYYTGKHKTMALVVL